MLLLLALFSAWLPLAVSDCDFDEVTSLVSEDDEENEAVASNEVLRESETVLVELASEEVVRETVPDGVALAVVSALCVHELVKEIVLVALNEPL